MKGITDKLCFIKVKNYSMKAIVKRMRRPQTGTKCLQNTNLIKDWYPKCIKNSGNSTIRKRTTQLKNE